MGSVGRHAGESRHEDSTGIIPLFLSDYGPL